MAGHREEKINEEVKRTLTGVIREIKDPRVKTGMVSVLKTVVTKDLKFCKAYISVLGNEENKKEVLNGLESAKGYIRRQVADNLRLRITPQFNFVIDNSLEEGDRILKIMNDLK